MPQVVGGQGCRARLVIDVLAKGLPVAIKSFDTVRELGLVIPGVVNDTAYAAPGRAISVAVQGDPAPTLRLANAPALLADRVRGANELSLGTGPASAHKCSCGH
jgi:hypothetical protein